MKKIALFLYLLLIPFLTGKIFAQCDFFEKQGMKADTSYTIRYSGYTGYIFPDNYHGSVVDSSVETFRLTHKQVGRIEEILYEQYNDAFRNDARVSPRFKPVKDIKSYLKNFDRQYLGFMNANGERCALLILANRKGKNRGYFPCFERVMTIGTGDFYGKYQRFFIINMDKSRLMLA